MMKKHRSLTALALAVALVFSLTLPAQAAAPGLSYTQSGNTVQLKLQNLGQESVYGVQLELTLEGSYSSALFTPSTTGAYAPPCHRTEAGDATQVTIYLTAQTPLNSGSELSLGALTMPDAFTMPDTATALLLGRDLQPIGDVQPLTVTKQSSGGSGGNPGGGGGGGGALTPTPLYDVTIASTNYGKITCSANKAAQKTRVTLTATPDEGYVLGSLEVRSTQGGKLTLEELGGGRYAFSMPAYAVEIVATFRAEKAPVSPAKPPFTDTAVSAWYYDAVCYVYEKGMMNGVSDTAFGPEVTTSRAMIVTILHRLEDTPAAKTPDFPDVADGQYYTAAVGWAAEKGIVNGYETGEFRPNDPITREQLAAILYRYASATGCTVSQRGDLTAFADYADVSSYAAEAMSWAVGAGLLSGMGDGTVSPSGQATRAQVAIILQRFCQNVKKV